jgi:HSP20 family protein
MRRRRTERACVFLPAAGHFRSVIWRPAVDVYRTRSGWLAKFDLAGIRLEDLQLCVQGNRLSVQGVRRDTSVEEGCHYHSLEISYSQFERQLEFPVDLSQAQISTEYLAGMLLVRIETEKERR